MHNDNDDTNNADNTITPQSNDDYKVPTALLPDLEVTILLILLLVAPSSVQHNKNQLNITNKKYHKHTR